MTVQVRDTYKLKYFGYEVDYVAGQLDFRPQDFGIIPAPPNTACWRGFYCQYIINKKGFFLEQLNVCAEDDHYPQIYGVTAVPCKDGTRVYRNLGLKVDFTGSVFIGKKPAAIKDGFKIYRTGKEMVFENGDLLEIIDE